MIGFHFANTRPMKKRLLALLFAFIFPFAFYQKNMILAQANQEDWQMENLDTSYINPNRKLIALTFDDAPSRLSENLLAVFAAYNEKNPDCLATATVFYNGCKFSQDTFLQLQTARTLGFELGNHTFSHYDLTKLSKTEISREIERTDAMLKRVDGRDKHLFRAPFGNVNEDVKTAVLAPIIDWTIDPKDWTGVSENDIYNTIFSKRFDGAIVLLHDGYENTLLAVKRLLPDLKEAGYQVVSISAMAKAHRCTLKNGSVYIRLRPKIK